eukprot:8456224-Ditylum_brightwellii.AAC.1
MAALFFTNFSPEYRKAMEAMGFTLPQQVKGLKEKRNQAGKRIKEVLDAAVKAKQNMQANIWAFAKAT